MGKYVLTAFAVLLLLVAFLFGAWYGGTRSLAIKATVERKILHYVDPMNPSHVSDKPGIAPCGMKMEAVYAEPSKEDAGSPKGPGSAPVGTVRISPEKQQLMGVELGVVAKGAQQARVRAFGRVAADETNVYRVIAAVDGWIQETRDRATGDLAAQGQVLASYYSPEFLAAEQAYLYALDSLDRVQANSKETPKQFAVTRTNIQQYIDSLHNLGMSDAQIREIADTRRFSEKILIVAPVTGFITSRNVSPGQRFDKGSELYRLVDLRRVWILADLFQNEGQYVRPGAAVRVTLPQQKKTVQARVSEVLPLFDGQSRTLKVRLEADNPGYVLRPDMFVDVEFPLALPSALTVPSDAVLDSGMEKRVFVDRGNGLFEPRKVATGWHFDNRIEITKGLVAGERIVVSGNFIVDSESKMKAGGGMRWKAQ